MPILNFIHVLKRIEVAYDIVVKILLVEIYYLLGKWFFCLFVCFLLVSSLN